MTQLDYTPWIFDGLLSTEKHANQNQVGASATAYLLSRGLAPFGVPISRCLRDGMLFQSPTSQDICKVDDYICAIAAMYGAGLLVRKHPPVWFWRFTAIWPHAKFRCYQHVWPLGRLIWAISVYIASTKPFSNQDTHMQTALMARTYEFQPHRSWLCDLAVKRWKKHIQDSGYSMARIFTEYSGFPEHPLTYLWSIQDLRWGFK